MKVERTRGAECLSDLAFDQWRAGEYEGHNPQPHVDSCPRCAARLLTIDADRESFRSQIPAFVLPARRPQPGLKHKFRRWLAPGLPLLVAAAVLLLWIRSGHHDEVSPPANTNGPVQGTRLKGGPSIGYYIKSGTQVQLGEDHSHLVPNDAVRFTYSSSDDHYLVIASRDGANAISIYYAEGEHGAFVEKGSNTLLSESVILDNVLGKERVYGFFCEHSVSVAAVRAALTTNKVRPLIEGCSVSTLQWEKVAP